MKQSLFNQLDRQLRFIEHSCLLYDQGRREEAIRIATAIRVLIHRSRTSTPLLLQLLAGPIGLLDTCRTRSPDERVFHGLGNHIIMPFGYGEMLLPMYGRNRKAVFKSVSEWWSHVVVATDSLSMTRSAIVLEAANKDGGAHVDERIGEPYSQLASEAFIGNLMEGNDPLGEANLVALRQMGYELLNSPELITLASRAEPLVRRMSPLPTPSPLRMTLHDAPPDDSPKT